MYNLNNNPDVLRDITIRFISHIQKKFCQSKLTYNFEDEDDI